MFNLYTHVLTDKTNTRKLTAGEQLVTHFTCPLTDKYADIWSHHNYIVYVMEGRKIWHTAHGSYDLQKGSCVFVRAGASIIEQNLDSEFCYVIFFIP